MTYPTKRIIIFEEYHKKGGNDMEATRMKPRKTEPEYAMLAIHKDLHKEVKAFCAAKGYTMISLVEALLKSYMSQNNRER